MCACIEKMFFMRKDNMNVGGKIPEMSMSGKLTQVFFLVKSKSGRNVGGTSPKCPRCGWACLPQLGIVSDDLRLGLREGRSSTELRWPPAKIHAWRPTDDDGLRPKNTWAGDVWCDGLRPKTRVSVWSDVSRAKACVGRTGAGAIN
jgi:hypothetical protein